jgi:nitrosocyanin
MKKWTGWAGVAVFAFMLLVLAPAWAEERTFLVVTGEWSWKAKQGEAPVVDRERGSVKEIERYVFDPGFLVVNRGDRVTLKIHALKGDKHIAEIPAFGVKETQVLRGEEKTISFVADKAGVFEIKCTNHIDAKKEGPMVGYLYVMAK